MIRFGERAGAPGGATNGNTPRRSQRTVAFALCAALAFCSTACKTPNISSDAPAAANTTNGAASPSNPSRSTNGSASPANPAPAASASAMPIASTPSFEFVEFVSAGARPSERLPLIVLLHGLGDRPENFAKLFDDFERPARFVVPHSATSYGDGFSWFDFRRGDPDFSAPGIARAADALSSFIVALGEKRPTAGKPIVTGFSQGGALSFAIAARHPDAVAFAISMSGWLPASLVPEARPAGSLPPIVALHGTSDPLIPIERAHAAVTALEKDGFSAELREFDGEGHTVSPAARATLYALLENAIALGEHRRDGERDHAAATARSARPAAPTAPPSVP